MKRTQAEQALAYGERRRSAAEVAALVQRIADDMASGRWVAGLSHKRYAEEEGVERITVAKWAAEASRRVHCGSDDDLQELKAATIGRLGAISLKAEHGRQYMAAVRALDSQAEIAGLKVNGPIVTINLEQPSTATDKRLRAQVDARDALLLDALGQALDECVPDRATRGRVLGRMLELMRPRDGDGAMVVQTIGGK